MKTRYENKLSNMDKALKIIAMCSIKKKNYIYLRKVRGKKVLPDT